MEIEKKLADATEELVRQLQHTANVAQGLYFAVQGFLAVHGEADEILPADALNARTQKAIAQAREAIQQAREG